MHASFELCCVRASLSRNTLQSHGFRNIRHAFASGQPTACPGAKVELNLLSLMTSCSTLTPRRPVSQLSVSTYSEPCLLDIVDSIEVASALSFMRIPNSMLRFSAL